MILTSICDVNGIALHEGKQIPANMKEAFRYLKMAAGNGDVNSMKIVSNMLKDGDGIPVDMRQVASYFKMATDNGSQISMSYYRLLLYNGEGVEQNKDEAIRY